METTNTLDSATEAVPAAKTKKNYLKIFLYTFFTIYIVFHVSDWLWVNSGSNQWELSMDKDDVKIWTLKTPGSRLIKVKGNKRIKAKMSSMVMLMEDKDACADAGCFDPKLVEAVETVPGEFAQYFSFRFALPGPMATREFVIYQHRSQDPTTKVLETHIIATPNKVHPDECCVRVTHMHNYWRITPHAGGEIEVEFTQDTDVGGSIPYYLTNLILPEETFTILGDLENMLDKDKYKNAQIDGVLEF